MDRVKAAWMLPRGCATFSVETLREGVEEEEEKENMDRALRRPASLLSFGALTDRDSLGLELENRELLGSGERALVDARGAERGAVGDREGLVGTGVTVDSCVLRLGSSLANPLARFLLLIPAAPTEEALGRRCLSGVARSCWKYPLALPPLGDEVAFSCSLKYPRAFPPFGDEVMVASAGPSSLSATFRQSDLVTWILEGAALDERFCD